MMQHRALSLYVATVLEFSFEVRSLVNALNASLTARFRPLGLTCTQAEALLALDDLGTATLKQLASRLIAESGHPSRLISRLVHDGLITRSVSEQDARAVALELTEEGRRIAGRARRAREPLVSEFARRYGRRLDDVNSMIRQIRQDLADGIAPSSRMPEA